MSRKTRNIIIILLLAVLAGWGVLRTADLKGSAVSDVQMIRYNRDLVPAETTDDYRTTYEIFVGSFSDSDGDGIGDLNGIRNKLDYIADTGFDQIWLTPIFPSDTYHKYDAKDYFSIDPAFGTMEDFAALVEACHERGIRVLLDLPLNHTSSAYPWFVQASECLQTTAVENAGNCPYMPFYHFSREAQDGYAPLGESGWYYEARFWSEMPDLNLDDPGVRNEIFYVLAYWLDHGADGFRLDAVTSYYTGNPEANREFLRWLKETCTSLDPDSYLVGEAWTDRKSIAALYESGIDSLFDFPFGNVDGIIYRAITGDVTAAAYVKGLELYEDTYTQANPDYIDAPFYTNHDMARSAGYYAADDGPKTKMAYALNLFMAGNAFVYYGEELGMKGSGKDENKRQPMLWGDDYPAVCAPPAGSEPVEMKFGSLAEQMQDDLSLYRWFREVIRVRRSFPAIAHGRTVADETLCSDTIAAFRRTGEGLSPVLVVMNLSAEGQDLSVPAELAEPAAVLNTSREDITMKNSVLHMPAYSIAVFALEE